VTLRTHVPVNQALCRAYALCGLGSAEVRTRDGVRRVAIHLAAEAIKVGRARGHEVEPLRGIEAQRFVDATDGKNLADVRGT
jgi:hypothetical protein